MSAYSDWKCGAIDDDEYISASRREFAGDNEEPSGCEGCPYYKLTRINMFTIRKQCKFDSCVKDEEEEEDDT